MPENPGNRGRLDPMQKARDFIYTPRPRVRPISPARKLQQIERQARDAGVSAAIAGSGGGASSVPIFDVLPDPTPEDVGSIIYIAGAAGQPAEGLMGMQTADDRTLWEPVVTQLFYGARTPFIDDILDTWRKTFFGGGGGTIIPLDGGVGHPGCQRLRTGIVSGDRATLDLDTNIDMTDVDRCAFIARTGSNTASTEFYVGMTPAAAGANAGGLFINKGNGETNWRFVRNIGDVLTRQDSGLSGTVTDNWFLFQIEHVSGTNYQLSLFNLTASQFENPSRFTFDLGAGVDKSTRPVFQVITHSAAARDYWADFAFIQFSPTVRS